METVSFTRMSDGTSEDYALLDRLETEYVRTLPDRLLDAVNALEHTLSGYQVTRREHSLQSATRALRDGRDQEYVVAALVHDVGDVLAPYSHGELVGAILRPYVREELRWVVSHHGVFQMYHYGAASGDDPNARDRFAGHPWFDACAEFCERYDQNCFDPGYDWLEIDTFEPMVRRVFSTPRYLEPGEA